MTILEIKQRRTKAVADARAVMDAADADGRTELNAEEQASYDKAWNASTAMAGQIAQRETLEAAEAELAEAEERAVETVRADTADTAETARASRPETFEFAATGGGKRSMTMTGPTATAAYEDAFRGYLSTGNRGHMDALQADSDSAGGYLSPQRFQASIIQALDNAVFVRQLANVLPPLIGADSLGIPSLDNDPADPSWVAEIAIGSEDSTMSFGKRELKPHPLAQFVKVSKTLARKSAIPIDSLVRERLVYKSAVVEENAFLNGSGALQPLGLFTASDDGIGTGRDVSTGNTTTEIRADGLIEAKYKLTAQYRRNAVWIFHRDAVKQVAKLKDGEGQYLWHTSLVAGQPDSLLAAPIYESEYAPNTFTTGLYVGLFGNLGQYWIVDALTMTVQKLVELYAGTNQDGYLSRREGDGMPVLAAAFARVKLA